jgi:hypothetical protein
MAIGPAGRFTFTYPGHRFEDLYARSAPPSGKLGPARLVASGQVSTAALWYQGTQPRVLYGLGQEDYQRLRERRIGAGGPSRVVADHLPNAPRYAVDTASNGVQVAAWSSYPGSNAKEPLVVGIRRPGRAFKVQQLDFRVPPETLDVAAAPSGAAEIAWGEWNPPTDDDPPPTPEYAPGGRIVTAYRPAGGPFGAPQAFRRST